MGLTRQALASNLLKPTQLTLLRQKTVAATVFLYRTRSILNNKRNEKTKKMKCVVAVRALDKNDARGNSYTPTDISSSFVQGQSSTSKIE